MCAFSLVIGFACCASPADGDQPPDPEQLAAAAVLKSLGVDFAVLESKVRRSITSTKTPYGFKIRNVEKDSLAAKAGWKQGDILLEWQSQPVRQLAEVDAAIQKSQAGEAVPFKLARYKKDAPALSRQPWEYIDGKIAPK